MRTYADWRRYSMTPEAGGLEDQPYEWKQQLDVVHEAKEWAESMLKAEQNVKDTEAMLDQGEEPSEESREASTEAMENYENIQEAHKDRLKAIRSWWLGEDWEDPNEAAQKLEEEEFMRFLDSLE